MKILITGKSSYVGEKLREWLLKWPDKYEITFLSLRGDEWRNIDFSVFDVIVHLVALVHQKESPKMKEEYNKINRDLTIEVALKAKREKVSQFIFLSSMSVYGLDGNTSKEVIIKNDTSYHPNTYYGKSKLEAEILLGKLEDNEFTISIIRPPMIYGADCPGNYQRLRKVALVTPIFPQVTSERSMIYIDNLSEFIKLVIDNRESGVLFPQNKEFVITSKLVELIAINNGKRIYFSEFLGKILILLARRSRTINKVIGDLKYETKLSSYKDFDYCIYNLSDSIKITENKPKGFHI